MAPEQFNQLPTGAILEIKKKNDFSPTGVTIEGRPCYKIVKARQVDRFKRFYTSEARAMSIEDAKAGKIEFRDRTKLYTAKDFVGRDYRLFA